jgi:hypothetical protein
LFLGWYILKRKLNLEHDKDKGSLLRTKIISIESNNYIEKSSRYLAIR